MINKIIGLRQQFTTENELKGIDHYFDFFYSADKETLKNYTLNKEFNEIKQKVVILEQKIEDLEMLESEESEEESISKSSNIIISHESKSIRSKSFGNTDESQSIHKSSFDLIRDQSKTITTIENHATANEESVPLRNEALQE